MRDSIITFKDKNDRIMAILIQKEHSVKGISFVTDDSKFQQIACMGHDRGHSIVPHYHNKIERTVDYTCETLIIKKGVLRVNLYDEKELIHSFNILEGDILTLYSGGHGFEAIEDIEMVEIKQGPYVGEADKTRF